ncbi:Chemotaxis protein, MotA [Bacillus cereus 95/8201]|uniref:Chemotaxis protein MotA n=2 Tax=Bacillus cereus group TaxID=86661 RepID=Q6HKS4_BACHK|nr:MULTISPECIES: flagellar motor protein MotP [Bacillus]OON59042.1 flagellar motor protein MotP [Klebsiella pneumoniae]AAT59511.1 chemotaxis protein MotA [[Bacillus thuringiensis] serovar konkukian str. 97-27]ACK90282.1 putative chemotaxis protein MotA [Bacillus cereus AH820]AJH62085.1 motA/TolQ/ExbB proton channel family protein [Bacillus cereus]AJH81552.1 motA/TolQ/ExbB proton channel family protein [Bacillus thuringiensis]
MGDENQVFARPERKKRKFDISSPVGIIVGFAIVIAAIMLGGGGIKAFKNFLDVSSILIVIGGTTATIVVAYRFGEIKKYTKSIFTVLHRREEDLEQLTDLFVDFSKKSKKHGLLSLEVDGEQVDNPFIQKGIRLMLSGYDEDELKEVLMKDVETEVYELRKGAVLLDKIGDFAPAWGMIGTLIGLIIMLQNLQDTSQIGTGMAVAMLTTLYGSVLANMIAIPLSEKVYRGIEDLYTEKKFVIEAISELYRGQIPSKLKLKLDTYVYETKIKKVKRAA